MTFSNQTPFVIVTSNSQDIKYKGQSMIGFATKDFVLHEFVPAPDSEERKILSTEEFLTLYNQDKMAMRSMVEKARRVLGQK